MDTPKIFESEYRFMLILWERGAMASNELVRECQARLEWKKSTTYTVIKRLSERGVVKLENAVVTALVTQDQVQLSESREFLGRTFGGSLPAFIAAFTGGKALSREDAEAIRRLIDEYEEQNHV